MAKIEIEIPDHLYITDGVFIANASSTEDGQNQLWYSQYNNPTLSNQLGLIEAGKLFVQRTLVGRHE